MTIAKSLLNYLKKNKEFSQSNTPEGLCPNC